MIKFYCQQCNEYQPVEIEPVEADELNDHPWGDIVCKVCHLVIATISADEPGEYEFAKRVELKPVKDIPKEVIDQAENLIDAYNRPRIIKVDTS